MSENKKKNHVFTESIPTHIKLKYKIIVKVELKTILKFKLLKIASWLSLKFNTNTNLSAC